MNRSGGRSVLLSIALAIVSAPATASAPNAFGFTPVGGPIARSNVPGLRGSDPENCAACHAEVVSEWRESMHGRSFVDPVFEAERRETHDDRPCVACHAPLATDPRTERASAESGVACAACHVRDGAVLGVRSIDTRGAHPIRVEPRIASAEFCGGCHEFRFPATQRLHDVPYSTDALQQATESEWRASAAARSGRSCVDCHMPEVRRADGRVGRSHRVLGLRDHEFVAHALDTAATTETAGDDVVVRIRLTIAGAGHSVPTGDIFRQLRVRAWNDGGSAESILEREFAETWSPDGFVMRDSYDARVHPGEPRTVELRLPNRGGPIRYDVAILRLRLPGARRRGLDPDFVVSTIASGETSARR